MRRPKHSPGRERRGELADLEGFSVGLQQRLLECRRQGTPDAIGERMLGDARGFLRSGEPERARVLLEKARERIAQRTSESELREFPRGLVGYVPRGDRGTPITRAEDPVANRLLLVGRLVELRRSQGFHVEEYVQKLTSAEAAYGSGDRTGAREIVDRVHSQLEALEPRGASDAHLSVHKPRETTRPQG